MDGSLQPSLFYKSESKEKRPLLVGLHSWSHDRFNQIGNMLPLAEMAIAKRAFADVAYFEPFYLKDFVATKAKNQLF